MTIKRIIIDIDEKLHKRIKDCSIRDDRTLNSTIKKVLAAGIGIIEIMIENNNDIIENNNDIIETVSNNHKKTISPLAFLTDEELHNMYDRTLTSFELNKVRKDPKYKPDKKVIIINDSEYKEFVDYGRVLTSDERDAASGFKTD